VVLGIVLGLSITRLLTGVARFMQYPGHNKAYTVHLGWVFSMLLTLVHFWWWEFRLSEIPRWTFEVYIFLVTYTILPISTLHNVVSRHDRRLCRLRRILYFQKKMVLQHFCSDHSV
jgi:MFS superfamily sulfate permease-like transporter